MKVDEIREMLNEGLEGRSSTDKGVEAETFLVNGSVIQAPETGREDLIRKNSFFTNRLSGNGVPVPELLFHQRNPAFMIYDRIEGLDLAEAEQELGEREYLNALRESGKTLAKIHQVEGSGYGEPDPENFNEGKYSSWRSFVRDRAREIDENVESWPFDLVVDRAMENLETDEIPENTDSAAFHNDYGRENVIFDGEDSYAIDLDNLIYGDPRLEFIEAEKLLKSGDKEKEKAFRQGYINERDIEIPDTLEDNYVAFAVLRAAEMGDYVRENREDPELQGWVEGLHRWIDQRFKY